MVFVGAFALIFLCISLSLQFGYHRYPMIDSVLGRVAVAGLWGLIGAGIGAVLGLGIALLATAVIPNQTYCDNPVNTQLYSMTGGAGTTGSFLYIDQNYSYHYFVNDNSAISESDIDSGMGVIYEDSTPATAHTATYTLEYKWGWRPFVIGNGGLGCQTEFHVPPGTVSRSIQVNP